MKIVDIIYIYYKPTTANGILVIVNNLRDAFERNGYKCLLITSLDGIPKNAFVIPYALEPAIELIRNGYKTNVAFMTDAYTLGHLNKIKFYLRRGTIFCYDFPRSIYCYIQEGLLERHIVKHFKQIILVSQVDIEYLKSKYPSQVKYVCVPNGANFSTVQNKTNANDLRLGMLLSWSHKVLISENEWLINDYFTKYIKRYPKTKLILAGRGNYIHKYSNLDGVVVEGEVDDLNDFFKNIDVFLVANPKGCGILNRVLDAFVYKTCVLGVKGAFTGFSYMDNSFLEFDSYKSFERNLELLRNSQSVKQNLIDTAYDNISRYNSWVKNYDKLVKELVTLYNLK